MDTMLPDDLVEEVLLRLPVRHLLQLRSINKSWCALINSYSFMIKHYQIQYANAKDEGDIPLFMDRPFVDHGFGRDPDPPEFYIFSEKQDEDVALRLIPDLRRDSAAYFVRDPGLFNSIHCMGAANGVVVLRWKVHHAQQDHLGLWNPATREFKAVPHPRPNPSNPSDEVSEWCPGLFGFGFDSESNDFKIVQSIFWGKNCVENDTLEVKYLYELYSLRTNSWKSLEQPLPNNYLGVEFSCRDAYVNGVHYWIGTEFEGKSQRGIQTRILCFDFIAEDFKVFDPPPAASDPSGYFRAIVTLYMKYLALVLTRQTSGEATCHFEIWTVSRFNEDNRGIPLSWQHLLTIGPVPAFHGVWSIAFRTDGDLLLTVQIDPEGILYEQILYNPSECTSKKLDFEFCCCYKYVESLFPIAHSQVHK